MPRHRFAWPSLPGRTVADVLAGHSAVGLALGALIYLVCVTGTLCVFDDALALWEQPRPAPGVFHDADADRLTAAAVGEAGGPAKAPLIFLTAPQTAAGRVSLGIGDRRWTAGPGGALVPLRLPWTEFLARLHYTLTLPGPWGEMLVGVLGMGLLSLLSSGVLAHPRILRDAFILRWGGSRRVQEADLHNRIGVWGLPFHLVVTASGALFGLANLFILLVAAFGFHGDTAAAYRPLEAPPAPVDARPAPSPLVGAAIARGRALMPGSRLSYFSVAGWGTEGARVNMEVTAPGRLPRGEGLSFDRRARLVGRTRYATGPAGLQLYSAAAQLHFGFFGGLPVRLAYGVLGLGLCWVCAGGISIYLARRRDRGRPAPRLERLWSGWVWGSPLALALSALPFGWPPAAAFWGLAVVPLALSQLPGLERFDPERAGRGALGAGLLLLVAARLVPALASAGASTVEALLALAGGGLVFSARPRPRSRRAGG